MLTLPQIIERTEQPYIAVRRKVTIPFNDEVDHAFAELKRWTTAHQAKLAGAAFFKYDLVAMPKLELEFGFPTQARMQGDERVTSGVLPAGKYASITYQGPYSNLTEVNAVLIGWAKQKQLRWDVRESPSGDRFGCRLEIYETDPSKEPNPNQWKTTVAIRLADGG